MLAAFPDSTFEAKSPAEKSQVDAAIRSAARLQGFEGDIVILWEDSSGRTACIAPPQQQPFFEIAKYSQLRAQSNGSLDLC
ncbi:MAG TPA: hypothetical protein VGJ09_00750 [Bryobacteraceae bacterium]